MAAPGQTFDPRNPWDRARRIEIVRYAKEQGIAEIDEQMPKDLMVRRLTALGVPPPSVPPRMIGIPDARTGDTSPDSHRFTAQQSQPTELAVLDAADVLERDWQAQRVKPAEVNAKPVNEITELRKECKRRGIKLARTDNKITLKAKLSGQ